MNVTGRVIPSQSPKDEVVILRGSTVSNSYDIMNTL